MAGATVVSQHRTSQGLVVYLRDGGGMAAVVVPEPRTSEGPMHPIVTHLAAQALLADREREAAAARLAAQARHTPRVRGNLRVALGYRLVELGLHLAVHPAPRHSHP